MIHFSHTFIILGFKQTHKWRLMFVRQGLPSIMYHWLDDIKQESVECSFGRSSGARMQFVFHEKGANRERAA